MRYVSLFAAILLSLSFAIAQPTTKPANDVLSRPLKEVRFDQVALADVLDFLGTVTKTTITADWNSLRKEQIDVTSPVTITAKDATLGKVLDQLLEQLSPQKKLTYVVDKETIEISRKPPTQ
jgi:hypothetical protein